jgi:transcription-repair coupling factor (superfamily II helicase)
MYMRMLDETVRHLVQGDGAPKLVPSDVSLDRAAYLPDEYIASQEAKLDLYRRLGTLTVAAEIDRLRDEVRDRFGPLPEPAEAFFATAQLRVIGGTLGVEGILVRGEEARVSFRESAVPRMKALGGAFHDVQFQVDIRRAQPLALKLTRLGGAEILSGLVRALRQLVP